MNTLNVRIVKLPPMYVASYIGFGSSPEQIAWDKLLSWARPQGLLEDLAHHRLFGFNNPCPSVGSPNYGYEVWIVVDPQAVDPGEDIVIKEFEGGLYAVTECVVPKGKFEEITEAWRKLAAWREDSPYKSGRHQCLEESLAKVLPGTEFVLDLYLPIAD